MLYFVIHGPNLNMLGTREVDIYGKQDFASLCTRIETYAAAQGDKAVNFQSNHEGEIIDAIQAAQGQYDGIIINPGAYTHYSYAIHDALTSVTVPAFEVHLSDITKRESWRAKSVISDACVGTVMGKGFDSYLEAMQRLKEKVR